MIFKEIISLKSFQNRFAALNAIGADMLRKTAETPQRKESFRPPKAMVTTMKKVVLFGDSIRLSYCERVKELLKDVCEVYYPADNCAHTMNTLWNVRFWIKAMNLDKIDVIHWNNGIWDHHRTTEDHKPLLTVDQYLFFNERLYNQLATYTDKLIWATTTPAGLDLKYDVNSLEYIPRDEWNREIALYNSVLSAFLSAKGVKIDDLNGLIGSDMSNICPDGIHLSAKGVEAAAQQVAGMIREML